MFRAIPIAIARDLDVEESYGLGASSFHANRCALAKLPAGKRVKMTVFVPGRFSGMPFVALGLAALALASCGILPSSGPITAQIVSDGSTDGSNPGTGSYELIDVDQNVLRVVKSRKQPTFKMFADGRGPVEPVIGPGDVIKITIWEAAPGGLFSSQVNLSMGAGSQSVTLPDQVVTQAGTISVPFVGRVKVSGLTPQQVESRVQGGLRGKAVDPQVVASIVRSNSSAITVTGDAVQGAQVPLAPNGYRILDAIAAVGGIKTPANETFITLTRAGQTEDVPFSTLLGTPAENVFLRPKDILNVTRRPVTFVVLGAAGRNAEVDFGAPSITLAQAIGKAGGLTDIRADAQGVFIFRKEQAKFVAAMGRQSTFTALGTDVPVVYRFDFSAPNGLFAAQSFPMLPGDLLYVSNSPATEVEKFLRLIQLGRDAVDMVN
jgi:polysaccharide export outer membrane protein